MIQTKGIDGLVGLPPIHIKEIRDAESQNNVKIINEKVREIDIYNKGFIYNIDAVREQVINIISIPVGSILFNREFAIDLEAFLFQPFTLTIGNLIAQKIEDTIRFYLPFITLESIIPTSDYDRRVYSITITIYADGVDEPITISKDYQSYAQ